MVLIDKNTCMNYICISQPLWLLSWQPELAYWQVWSPRLFCYVYKMATAEDKKGSAFHTQPFFCFEHNIQVLAAHFILRQISRWVHLFSQNRKRKYRRTQRSLCVHFTSIHPPHLPHVLCCSSYFLTRHTCIQQHNTKNTSPKTQFVSQLQHHLIDTY